MSILRETVCFLVIFVLISHSVAKTVKPTASSSSPKEVKVVNEGRSDPEKADNATTSLQENWSKIATEKSHKAKKIDKDDLVSVQSNGNETSLQTNTTSTNETNVKPDPGFQEEVSELSLGSTSDVKDNISADTAHTTTDSLPNGSMTEFTVTSPPLILKQSSDNATATNSTPVALSPDANKLIDNDNSTSSVQTHDNDEGTEYNFKDKVRPSFHQYMEEILNNKTSMDEDVPIIIKQNAYLSSQNALEATHPYGHLPSFSEKELGRLRLNHWRVKQMFKGSEDIEAEKRGLPGSRKAILQSKYPHPVLGQKRSASREATYLDDSAADSLSSLLTSADQDRTPGQVSSNPPSNLRTFFSWFTNPSKEDPNYDSRRAEEFKAQQAILPMALGYRGDFLFW